MCMYAIADAWKSEDNLGESVVSFRPQVREPKSPTRLANRHLYPAATSLTLFMISENHLGMQENPWSLKTGILCQSGCFALFCFVLTEKSPPDNQGGCLQGKKT